MVAQVIWHGTQQESFELCTALTHNCTCEFGLMGARTTTCPPHEALAHNQRFSDGLLYYRHLRNRLLLEEFE